MTDKEKYALYMKCWRARSEGSSIFNMQDAEEIAIECMAIVSFDNNQLWFYKEVIERLPFHLTPAE